MKAPLIRSSDPEVCRFSSMEATVLRRLGEGAGIETMARELGLAAPLVQEYIKSVLKKAWERADQQRP